VRNVARDEAQSPALASIVRPPTSKVTLPSRIQKPSSSR
jgi:hypothetical protein